MTSQGRIMVGLALVAAAVAAFVLSSSSLNDSGSGSTVTVSTVQSAVTATTPAERVVRTTVKVNRDGPIGGVAEIRAQSGERLVVTVVSSGYSGEVHLHGFDIKKDVAPGRPVTFVITAAQTKQPQGQGSFEMELEGTATQIARLLISP